MRGNFVSERLHFARGPLLKQMPMMFTKSFSTKRAMAESSFDPPVFIEENEYDEKEEDYDVEDGVGEEASWDEESGMYQ